MDSVDYGFGKPDGSGWSCAGARGAALRRLLAATDGLMRFELAVVEGAPLDADALDELLASYCAAMHAAAPPRTDAHAAARRGATPSGHTAPTDEELVRPAEPTPRLLFARWLVQQGRLSG